MSCEETSLVTLVWEYTGKKDGRRVGITVATVTTIVGYMWAMVAMDDHFAAELWSNILSAEGP